jgi:hypothetical protein
MNLEQWSRMREEQRKEFVLECADPSKWLVYHNLATEAAKALFAEIGKIPGVTNVKVSPGEVLSEHPRQVTDLILIVCTVPEGSHPPSNFPKNFSGFRVEAIDFGKRRAVFLKIWKNLFKYVAGWSEAKTEEWADQWKDALEGRRESGIFDRGPFIVAIQYGLIDETMRRDLGDGWIPLRNELLSIILRGTSRSTIPGNYPELREDFDWQSIKSEVNQVIKKHTEHKSS